MDRAPPTLHEQAAAVRDALDHEIRSASWRAQRGGFSRHHHQQRVLRLEAAAATLQRLADRP